MGLFDSVRVETGVQLPDFDGDPSEWAFQTKDIGSPAMQNYKITEDRRLLREETVWRDRTESEKQEYAEERDFDSWDAMMQYYEEEILEGETSFEKCQEHNMPIGGPREQVVEEHKWIDHNMHGSFEFYMGPSRAEDLEEEGYSWEARFSDGSLDEIIKTDRWNNR